MKLLRRLLKLVGLSVEVDRGGTCAVCGQGRSPALGVPIPTVNGTWKHLVCMTVGQQISEAAEQTAAQVASPGSQAQQPSPVILAIVRPAGREIWN